MSTDRVDYRHAGSHIGATLLIVAGQDNAQLAKDTRTEQVALAIFAIAYRTRESVTRRLVDGELGRLRSHPPACRCCEPCTAARGVSPSRVYWTARTWQNSITTRDVHGAGPVR